MFSVRLPIPANICVFNCTVLDIPIVTVDKFTSLTSKIYMQEYNSQNISVVDPFKNLYII